jgi:hypothetical protein
MAKNSSNETVNDQNTEGRGEEERYKNGNNHEEEE